MLAFPLDHSALDIMCQQSIFLLIMKTNLRERIPHASLLVFFPVAVTKIALLKQVEERKVLFWSYSTVRIVCIIVISSKHELETACQIYRENGCLHACISSLSPHLYHLGLQPREQCCPILDESFHICPLKSPNYILTSQHDIQNQHWESLLFLFGLRFCQINA